MSLQDDLNSLLAPAHQLFYGPEYDPDPISSQMAITGQLNPVIERRFAAQDGQYLSGVDGMNGNDPNVHENLIERTEHKEVYDLEQQDDTLGSGIFDPYNRPGTANTNTGVFTTHNSLPGYLAREIPFVVSNDVTDLTDDASIVSVPGGGMAYVEADGRLKGPAAHGMPPPHPQLVPPPPTGRDQTYVDLTPHMPTGWDVDSLLRSAEFPTGPIDPAPGGMLLPNGPMPPMPNGELTLRPVPTPGGGANYHAPGAPAPQPAPSLQVPTVPGAAPAALARRPNTPAFPGTPGSPANYRFPPGHPQRDPFYHLREVRGWPRQTRISGRPQERRVAQRAMINPEGTRIAIGQADEAKSNTSTWIAYGVAGLVAGAALRMFLGSRKARA